MCNILGKGAAERGLIGVNSYLLLGFERLKSDFDNS